MRRNRSGDILAYFQSAQGSSFHIDELAAQFGISVRQVKNYIRQINEDAGNEIIAVSDGQYYLKQPVAVKKDSRDFTSDERVSIIISMLLSAEEPLDTYDIAEDLFISDATLESDLKKIRRRLSPFNLVLDNNAGRISLSGRERDKRSLASYMITNTRYKGFLFHDDDQFINDDYQIEYLKDNLIRIFTECSFYYNDYSLNNIILHLIITIDRLRNNYFIEESQLSFSVTEVEQNATEKIVAFLEKTYDVKILPVEKSNIAAVLSSNLATLDYRVINRDNVTAYVRKETVELVDYILEKTTDYYMLDPFDDVFFARFSLHVDNLLKRLQMNHSIHNPMVMNIKLTYPLIFDIAVYAAALIEEKTGFRVNQDEISLLALHIGSFIESSDSNRNKVSAIYVYSDYHQFYQHNITSLQAKFEKELNILYTISINDYRSDMAKPDLVISEVPLPDSVTVSPFITDEQMERIQKLIRSRAKINESDRFVESLGKLFPRERFFMDLPGNDAFEIIQNLTSQLKDQELFDDSYVESVMTRERISSTCFVKKVAIPHAIGHSVKKSFISAITYSEKRIWGTEPVFLVILFGISYTDRKDFRFVFNHIVELLSKEANINAFCKCQSYDELMDTVNRISHGV